MTSDPTNPARRALVQIDFPLERLMPLIDTFHKNYNDEVVPRILEVCIEMDKVSLSLGASGFSFLDCIRQEWSVP